MFRSHLPQDSGPVIEPNNNVHTFWMRLPIDVVLDRMDRVVGLVPTMPPNRPYAGARQARHTSCRASHHAVSASTVAAIIHPCSLFFEEPYRCCVRKANAYAFILGSRYVRGPLKTGNTGVSLRPSPRVRHASTFVLDHEWVPHHVERLGIGYLWTYRANVGYKEIEHTSVGIFLRRHKFTCLTGSS